MTTKLGGFPLFSKLDSSPIVRPSNSLKLRMTVSVIVCRPKVLVAMWNLPGAGCRVQGAGCRVQSAGCRVQGAGAVTCW